MVTSPTDILPAALATDFLALARGMSSRRVNPRLVAQVVQGLGRQPLPAYTATAAAIVHHLEMFAPAGRSVALSVGSWRGWPLPGPSPVSLIARAPGIEHLMLFHASGYVREAALRAMRGTLDSPFWIVAVSHRLNDWVPQVRSAAFDAFGRTVLAAPTPALADAAIFLSGRVREWRRWGAEVDAFRNIVRRPAVARAIADHIAAASHGPMVRAMRSLMKESVVDPYLLMIARSAVQPGLRAAAFQALLDGQVKWAEGWQKKWLDRSFNLWRREPVYRTRALERPSSFDDLLAFAATDRSPSVRKVASRALISHADLASDPVKWAGLLGEDPNRAVREPARFYLERIAGS